jgi:hypothetical protein
MIATYFTIPYEKVQGGKGSVRIEPEKVENVVVMW